MTFSLKSITKHNIENCVSVPFSDLVSMDYDEKNQLLTQLKGEKVVFSKTRDVRKIGRGNPFLARRRFRTIEEVDKKITGIYNANIKRNG